MNNFKQIRSLLHYKNVGDFYFIQLFKRRKDNPDLAKSEKLIKSYSVFSLEEYDKLEEHILELCTEHNARAYIRLNRRNSRDVALHMITQISLSMVSKQTNHMYKIYDAICGRFNAEEQPTWVIDIDGDINELGKVIDESYHIIGQTDTFIKIPTLNGWHIITKPFNRMLFAQKFPLVDIHKDNPTLLYFNNSL